MKEENRFFKFKAEKNILEERYEDLRNEILCSGEKGFLQNQGFTLFLRHGMAGWMEAWSTCAAPAQPTGTVDNGNTVNTVNTANTANTGEKEVEKLEVVEVEINRDIESLFGNMRTQAV